MPPYLPDMAVSWLIPTPSPDAPVEADVWKFPELSISVPALLSFALDVVDILLYPDPLAVRSFEISPSANLIDSRSDVDLSRLKVVDVETESTPAPLTLTDMPRAGVIRPTKSIASATAKIHFVINRPSFISSSY
jgi:hypothetical protein